MRIRIAASATLPILLAFAALSGSRVQAQSFQAPPVTNGLWQSESTITMTGVPHRPTGSTMTNVTQSCMAPDTWKHFGHPDQVGANCKVTNFHQDAHRITYDASCGGTSSYHTDLHLELLIESAQHVVGTVLMKTSAPSMPNGMTMNTKFDSHFVSASCGGMKPGDVKTLKQ
ncbi:MAG: DUF3617 family protein [Acidobacteriaceae bacterium]